MTRQDEDETGLWVLREPTQAEQDEARRWIQAWQAAVRKAKPTKVCGKCGATLPRTAAFFRRNAGNFSNTLNADGLRPQCRACQSKRPKTAPGMRRCGHCKRERSADSQHFPSRGNQHDSWCWECRRAYDRARKSQQKRQVYTALSA
jgi:hypothetical protein